MKKHGAIVVGRDEEGNILQANNPWFSRQVKSRRKKEKAAKKARKRNR
jgi:hypothetical protein